MTSWTSLRTTDTHHVFATTHSLRLSDTWPWISGVVASEFECSPDDLGMADDEDGEFVTLRNEKIVEVVYARLVNAPRPLLQLAAE